MIEGSLGLLVEGLVCVLLVATIFYCISVNNKLERLRNEQKGMQGFIRDLSIATGNADKAIQGLRQTVEASGQELASQIDKGRAMSRQLKSEVEAAEQTMNRLIVLAGGAARKFGQAGDCGDRPAADPGRSVEALRRNLMGFEDLDGDDGLTIADEGGLPAGGRTKQVRGSGR